MRRGRPLKYTDRKEYLNKKKQNHRDSNYSLGRMCPLCGNRITNKTVVQCMKCQIKERQKITDDQILEDIQEGLCGNQIALKYGVSRQAVSHRLKNLVTKIGRLDKRKRKVKTISWTGSLKRR